MTEDPACNGHSLETRDITNPSTWERRDGIAHWSLSHSPRSQLRRGGAGATVSQSKELAVAVIQGTSSSAAQVGRTPGPGPERSDSHLSTACPVVRTLADH